MNQVVNYAKSELKNITHELYIVQNNVSNKI